MPSVRVVRLSLAVAVTIIAGCSRVGDDAVTPDAFAPEAISTVLAGGAQARALKLNHHALVLNWTVTKAQEEACGAPGVAGAEIGGKGQFTHLGVTSVFLSAAWDIAHLITGPAQFTPLGPASGPVAPVLGASAYPYAFQHNPLTGNCGGAVAATGKVVMTAANGDKVQGEIVGGEAHKLDFIVDGDGVEVFARVHVTGGTGRFASASGVFVVHAIGRMRPTFTFDITFAEILPGGTLGY